MVGNIPVNSSAMHRKPKHIDCAFCILTAYFKTNQFCLLSRQDSIVDKKKEISLKDN